MHIALKFLSNRYFNSKRKDESLQKGQIFTNMLDFPVGTQQDAYEFYDKLISKLLLEEGNQAI